MDMSLPEDRYILYENRLASFRGVQEVAKRPASIASSRAPKTLHWPHKFLPPVELAKSGFFFDPQPGNHDNVCCFLCRKNLDGWEDGDNALIEHLRHMPHCGWAVAAAIDAEMPEYTSLHPLDPRLLDARKATFAGKWPYEGKKGFKCKTKQLAEAGWKYTPTPESDDMATCNYCQLQLDGWEASDKPMDEHRKRNPDCPFFDAMEKMPAPPKKVSRGKGARGSKASRVSTQSVATVATGYSEMPSILDMAADQDDSAVTTTSVGTQGGNKKTSRGRKVGAPKGRKTRAKKDEAIEVYEDEAQEIEGLSPPVPKPAHGRKRTSHELDDSVLTTSEAPAPKKRATRSTRASSAAAMNSSLVSVSVSQAVDMVNVLQPAKKLAGRKRANTAKSRGKGSGSSLRSQASTAYLCAPARSDDDELELNRELEADLERPLTDEEGMAIESDSDWKKARSVVSPVHSRAKARKGNTRRLASTQSRKHKADSEMRALQAEVEAEGRQHDESCVALHQKMEAVNAPSAEEEAAAEVELQRMLVETCSKEDEDEENEENAKTDTETLVTNKGRKIAGISRKESMTTRAEEVVPPTEPPIDLIENVSTKELALQAGQNEVTTTLVSHANKDPDTSFATFVKKTDSRASTGSKRVEGRLSTKSTLITPLAREQEQDIHRPAKNVLAGVRAETELTFIQESFPVAAIPTEGPPWSLPYLAGLSPVKRTPVGTDKAIPALPQSSDSRLTRSHAGNMDRGTPTLAHVTPSPKQPALSALQELQHSDAENRPPRTVQKHIEQTMATAIGKKAAVAKKVVLAAAVTATPKRQPPNASALPSKSRTHMIAGLQSATPWTAVDVDLLFSPTCSESRGEMRLSKLLEKGSQLTMAEKNMTVADFIARNATLAADKLDEECETLVSAFEKEGSRAMSVLEGLIVD